MPYYCTVPRCTSMAGKAKNVSFHQFPRDEELAKLWNDILKRGKPYTKYSKVCSLHFKPEDYTITSAGKNKGQWRTLRKDAIPSQNLPVDTPAPYNRRQSSAWVPSHVSAIDPQLRQAQQLAQAIYMQTMLAMRAAGVQDPMALSALCNGLLPPSTEHSPRTTENPKPATGNQIHTKQDSPRTRIPENAQPATDNQFHTQQNSPRNKDTENNTVQQEPPRSEKETENNTVQQESHRTENDSEYNKVQQDSTRTNENTEIKTSYQCEECSKCFKDPDVFVLHKRTHQNVPEANGKENFDLNTLKPETYDLNTLKPETLKSNPILSNLLKSTFEKNFITKNMFEKQLTVSFSNMENFFRDVTKFGEDCDNSELSDNLEESNNLVIDENVA